MTRKKNIQFLIRTDEHSANTIRQKINSSGLSQQDYLLKAALGVEVMDPTPIRELLIEYKRQGNNLNQIARAMNSRNSMSQELLPLINALMEERDLVWQLLKQSIQKQA